MKSKVYFLIALLILCLGLLSIVMAQSIEVSTKDEVYKVGDKINVKVTIFDQNKVINDNVQIKITDPEGRNEIVKTIESNKFVEIDLGESATYGFWVITAIYGNAEGIGKFQLDINELAKFELHDDVLTITNIGNIRYAKPVQIVIGEVVEIKEPNLDISESITYRLVAPEGNYNVRITDGENSITRGGVALTGNVIGVLNDDIPQGLFLAPGVSDFDSEDSSDRTIYQSVLGNKVAFVFVLAVVGLMFLLFIERKYKSRVMTHSNNSGKVKKTKKK